MGAAGLSASTVAGGALAGASGAVLGSPVQGMGNAMYFGDAYSGGHFLTDVLAGGVLGGVAGGVAGWIKNAKNVRNGGQPGDIWGFGRAGKGQGVVEWGELKLSRQQDGFDLNYANPSKNRPPIEGLEYLDEGLRMTEQPFRRAFDVAPGKFNYFFGRVITGAEHNIQRSAQNLKDLTRMGITTNEQLMDVFNKALKNGTVISTKTSEFGTTIMRSVNVGNKGSIGVGFFYQGGNMGVIPSISTIIPKTW